MLAAIKQLLSPSPLKQQAYQAYVQVVEQARRPVFYSQWQVEDTIDGRFDVIVLHLFLLLSRLGQEGDPGEAPFFSRQLSEAFFSDMDRSIREMGAGDTGVGIRVKNMAEAFYGRMNAYQESIGEDGISEGALVLALKRNVYRDRQVAPEILASLAAYVGRNDRLLRQQSLDALQQGIITFSS